MMLGPFGIEKPPQAADFRMPVARSVKRGLRCMRHHQIGDLPWRARSGNRIERQRLPFSATPATGFRLRLSAMRFGWTFGSRSVCGMLKEMLAARGIIVSHESVWQ